MTVARIQPVIGRSGALWYYEWFAAGMKGINWTDATAAIAADRTMLDGLRAIGAHGGGVPLGVNVSFLTAAHFGLQFVDELSRCLRSGSVVEITEHAAAQATDAEMTNLTATCRALTERGYIIALDDCTGGHPFSDPMLWRRLLPRIIKVGVLDRTAASVAVKAHRAGLPVVFEQIETIGMSQEARNLGARGFQGYYHGCPLPYSPAIMESLRAQSASAS